MKVSFFLNHDRYYEFDKQFKNEIIIVELTNTINLIKLTNKYICSLRNFFNNQAFYYFSFRINYHICFEFFHCQN